ncbi:hypothetical protein [uncultured Kriegella sp.]|uniref:hypothetical protein n=1 Tax=uncultured Kriegella sp. TaxID=1798910 RepID=UPI0030D7F86E|tara:strand:+ start:168200 stop:168682 length:483 start_codon:yes stop_codon:yes gene_type:complete
MKYVLQLFPWKWVLRLSIITLLLLGILSFYGLYTDKFYFFKPDNYIFPLLSIIHFTFLYVMWFKIKENDLSDPPMRTLEYSLYVIVLVYLYKFFETVQILISYNEYENHVLPSSFFPIAILIMSLQLLLLVLTLMTFKYRKVVIGQYIFDDMNQHVDSWK